MYLVNYGLTDLKKNYFLEIKKANLTEKAI